MKFTLKIKHNDQCLEMLYLYRKSEKSFKNYLYFQVMISVGLLVNVMRQGSDFGVYNVESTLCILLWPDLKTYLRMGEFLMYFQNTLRVSNSCLKPKVLQLCLMDFCNTPRVTNE